MSIQLTTLRNMTPKNTTCWCVPEIYEEYGQIIVTHNAFDGRTLKENERERFSNGEVK